MSWSLPFPVYPQASIPSCSGPTKWQPSLVRVWILRCVAGWSHILPFMAGAMSVGALVAR